MPLALVEKDPSLGGQQTIEREVSFYQQRVQSERDSQDQPDDEVRPEAPDIVSLA